MATDKKQKLHERHLAKMLAIIGHDEDAPSSTSAVHCRGLHTEHQHLTDYMPELAGYIHKGVSAAQEGPVALETNLTFEDIDRSSFLNLRKIFGMDEAAYVKSIMNMGGGATQDSGKSGSLFWFSDDKKILMKSITEAEGEKMVDMMPQYTSHFQTKLAAGQQVLLCRFYGLYRLAVGKESVVMMSMNNVFGDATPDRIYDIKGTTEDRYVEPAPGHVMKDLNYAGMQVGLPTQEVDSIVAACESDSELLREYNIMDYSLLLGVFENPSAAKKSDGSPVYNGVEIEDSEVTPVRSFQMGIIDMLVDYSGKKIPAHWMKKLTIGCCQEIDTEPPDYYQRRFSENATEKIVSV